jgi:hypothetical protein
VFHMDVAKVDQDVSYVAMIWLYTYVASVCSKCFICFSNVCCKCVYGMLHMFHTYVTNVLSGCYICFTMTSQVF